MAKVQRGGPRASRNGKKPRAHLWLKLCASVVERPRLQRDVRDHVPPKKHQHSRRITYCGEPFARLCPASLAAAPDVGRKAPVARCIATRGIAKLDAARLPIDLDWTLRLCCAAVRRAAGGAPGSAQDSALVRNGTTECSRAGFIDNVPLSAPHAQELRFFWWGLTRAAAAARRQQRREPQQGHMHCWRARTGRGRPR